MEIVCLRCVSRVGKIDNVREMEHKHCRANIHSSDVLIMLRCCEDEARPRLNAGANTGEIAR